MSLCEQHRKSVYFRKDKKMERIKVNKHFNIIARIRANTEREMNAFTCIKKLETLLKNCCFKEPKIDLRYIDLSQANLKEWEKSLVLQSYACEISVNRALQVLKEKRTSDESLNNEPSLF